MINGGYLTWFTMLCYDTVSQAQTDTLKMWRERETITSTIWPLEDESPMCVMYVFDGLMDDQKTIDNGLDEKMW